MLQVLSYQIADNIEIKSVKDFLKIELLSADADELFYKIEKQKFIYIFKYGVICFLNCEEALINEFLLKITPFCRNLFVQKLSEEFQVEPESKEYKLGYNKIEILSSETEVLRLIMLEIPMGLTRRFRN